MAKAPVATVRLDAAGHDQREQQPGDRMAAAHDRESSTRVAKGRSSRGSGGREGGVVDAGREPRYSWWVSVSDKKPHRDQSYSSTSPANGAVPDVKAQAMQDA